MAADDVLVDRRIEIFCMTFQQLVRPQEKKYTDNSAQVLRVLVVFRGFVQRILRSTRSISEI